MKRYLIPITVFAVLVVLLGLGLRHDPTLVPSPLIDRPLPSFDLPRLSAADRTIGSGDLRGRPFLLNVWASWCVACRHEHPLLLEIAREGKVPLYGLNYKDTREDALHWLKVMGDPYLESAFDPEGRVGLDLGVYGVPETFVVDANGVIRYKQIGPITDKKLKDRILPLLREFESGETARR